MKESMYIKNWQWFCIMPFLLEYPGIFHSILNHTHRHIHPHNTRPVNVKWSQHPPPPTTKHLLLQVKKLTLHRMSMSKLQNGLRPVHTSSSITIESQSDLVQSCPHLCVFLRRWIYVDRIAIEPILLGGLDLDRKWIFTGSLINMDWDWHLGRWRGKCAQRESRARAL